LENGLILLLKVKIENQYFKNNIQYKFTWADTRSTLI
jgi:hypothetical protein